MSRQELLQEIKHLTPVEQFRLMEEILRSLRGTLTPRDNAPRHIALGGIWKGYSFDFDEIKNARRETWAALGRGFDE